MRLTAIVAAVALASVAQVAAMPVRMVLVTSSSQELPPNVRFGHAVDPNSVPSAYRTRNGRMSGPCKGRMGGFRQKSIDISNAFRHALGWPLIEETRPFIPVELNPTLRGPPNAAFATFWAGDGKPGSPEPGPHGGMAYREGKIRVHPHHHRHQSFITRLHFSLMNLGLWEGRAVAFVLGCGIGVLLRMFWVLAIVAYRVVRRRSSDEDDEYTHIVMFEEAEATQAPPPSYPVDEKLAIKEAVKPAEPAAESK